jgi:hypothetical protein
MIVNLIACSISFSVGIIVGGMLVLGAFHPRVKVLNEGLEELKEAWRLLRNARQEEKLNEINQQN